jgi:hypothetical protein
MTWVSHHLLYFTGTCSTCVGGFKPHLPQCPCASVSRTLSAAPCDFTWRGTEDTCQITAVPRDIFTLHSRNCACTLSIWLWVILMWHSIYNISVFCCKNILHLKFLFTQRDSGTLSICCGKEILIEVSSSRDYHLFMFRPSTLSWHCGSLSEFLCPICLKS